MKKPIMSKKTVAVICSILLIVGSASAVYKVYDNNKTIVSINGINIKKNELNRFMGYYKAQVKVSKIDATKNDVKNTEKQFLDEIVSKEILVQEYDKTHSDKEKEEISKQAKSLALSKKESLLNNSNEEIKNGFIKSKVKDEDMIRDIETNLKIEEIAKAIKINISEEEMLSYYGKNKLYFLKGDPKVELKIFSVPTEEEADSALWELKKGAKFEDTAKKFTINPEIKKDGGVEGKKSVLNYRPEILNAVLSLKDGEISGDIKIENNHYIIQRISCDDIKYQNYDEAKNRIKEIITEERRSAELSKLLENLKGKDEIKRF